MAVPQLVEQIGRVLDGRYRVTAPIGTGASAAVFLADDVTLRRRVAIKSLHAGLANDPAFLRRFQAEARTAAALSHPNIMRVLDWGEDAVVNGAPFLVLEYLGGGSLRAVLDHSETLTVPQALKVGLQAARALDYAHRRGLVHRDIKPGNLLFDEEERLAIADFGLARALAEAAWTEPGGALLGTARYASPEQVRGRSLDGKSDVYALGLVLIEAVTGAVPFTADTTLATLMGRLDAQLEAPEEMGALGPIVELATAPDPEDRIDAGRMLAMLEEAILQSPSAEKIELPGALNVDVTDVDELDRTMMPDGPRPKAPVVTPGSLAVATEDEDVPVAGKSKKPKKGKQPKEPGQKKVTPKRLVSAILALLLIIALAVGGYTLYYFTGSERPVPQLNGLSLDSAEATADQAGINLIFDGEEFSEDVPAGQTLEQSVAAGDTVHPRERVMIKVSRGPAPRAVTDVSGQQLEAGQPILEQLGFVVAVTQRYDETAPVNLILSQDPTTGELERGATVNLVTSQGPEPRVVPDVAGSSYDAAAAALAQRGLKSSQTEAYSDTYPAGQAIGTTPRAGGSAARDSTVNVVISRGPELITVPSVAGQTVTAATNSLTAAGFAVNNVYGPPAGRVFDTTPGTGAQARRGASIALYTR